MKKLLLFLIPLFAQQVAAQTLQQVYEFIPGNEGGDPLMLTVFNGNLYMAAKTTAAGRELWRYDGTNAVQAAEVNPGPAGGVNGYGYQKMAVLGGKLYFPGYTAATGIELMEYDGVNAPSLVADILPGSGTAGVYWMRSVAGKLFFAAETPSLGNELYIYDGVNPPKVHDLYAGILGSNPQEFTLFNNKVYFRADTRNTGVELWVYDPALDTVQLAADIGPSGASSDPTGLIVHNGKLYFRAHTAANGPELWSYDGTTATRLTDIGTGPNYGVAGSIAPYHNALYFGGNYTNTFGGNYQLYKYDLATGNASLVKVIDTVIGASPINMVVYKDKLYFTASTVDAGSELWMHDGTNTSMVVDFNPGPASTWPGELTIFNDELYMAATKGPGMEPELYKLSTATSIRQVRFAGDVAVSPNPAAGDAALQLNLVQPYTCTVTLTNIEGKLVWQSPATDFAAGKHRMVLPLAGQPAGTYFYQVRSNGSLLSAGKVMRQ